MKKSLTAALIAVSACLAFAGSAAAAEMPSEAALNEYIQSCVEARLNGDAAPAGQSEVQVDLPDYNEEDLAKAGIDLDAILADIKASFGSLVVTKN